MGSYTRKQLEDWLKSIKVEAHSKVLDIGGSQLPINKRIQPDEATEFEILDLEQPHEIKQAPDIICDLNEGKEFFNRGTLPIIKNYDSLGETALWEKYDSAFCIEVTEYWWNPVRALKNIYLFLKPGATLYISFHFIYPVHNPVEEDYLRYTERGAFKLLEECGFKVEEVTDRKAINYGTLDHFIREDGMRPSKNYNKHDAIGSLIKATKI